MSHADLIARLEKLEGPDCEVDTAIMEIADPSFVGSLLRHADPFTASLDAAVALVERVLPGAYGSVQFGTEPCQASILKDQTTVLPSGHYKVSTECSARASAATPAIALLIATLKALHEKHNER